MAKKLLPIERFGNDLTPTNEQRTKLLNFITISILNGWTDAEISYDINRTNGRCQAETGEMYGAIHVVNIVRFLLAERTPADAGGDPSDGATGNRKDNPERATPA